MGERLAGQPAALLQTEAFTIGHTGRDERIVGRVVTMATVALFFAAPRTMDGPPMSIFSMTAASSAPERTVSANGYKLTTTRSKA